MKELFLPFSFLLLVGCAPDADTKRGERAPMALPPAVEQAPSTQPSRAKKALRPNEASGSNASGAANTQTPVEVNP